MPNPSKILGFAWSKSKDELLNEVPEYSEEMPVTKKSVVSHQRKMYGPLGIVSPSMAEG